MPRGVERDSTTLRCATPSPKPAPSEKKSRGPWLKLAVGTLAFLLVTGVGFWLIDPLDATGDDCVGKYSGEPLPCDHSLAVPADSEEAREERAEDRSAGGGGGNRAVVIAKNALERQITKTAQEDVDAGVLEGPVILHTTCEPTGRSGSVYRFECLAVNEERGLRQYGYEYQGTANLNSGDITWELGD